MEFGRRILLEDNRNEDDNIVGAGKFDSKIQYDYKPLGLITCVSNQDG